MERARVKGLVRNLMIVAGNSGVQKFAGLLEKFVEHRDEAVRSHAKWAIEKLKGRVREEVEDEE
jgi:epoxyqueuosine reductase QueG